MHRKVSSKLAFIPIVLLSCLLWAGVSQGAGAYPENLESLCEQAGVRLHRRLTDTQGPLPSDEIRSRLRPGTSVWFCGPGAWGEALARTLIGNALPHAAFHREAFEFR